MKWNFYLRFFKACYVYVPKWAKKYNVKERKIRLFALQSGPQGEKSGSIFSAAKWSDYKRLWRRKLTCVGTLCRTRHTTIGTIVIQWHANYEPCNFVQFSTSSAETRSQSPEPLFSQMRSLSTAKSRIFLSLTLYIFCPFGTYT